MTTPPRVRCTCGSPFHTGCLDPRRHRPHRTHVRAHAGAVLALAGLAVIAVVTLMGGHL